MTSRSGDRPMTERIADPDVATWADEHVDDLTTEAEEQCRQILNRHAANQRREAT